jgi:peptidoglycan hydrolase-like protein with peptidoglycan-binding domain
MSKSKNLVIALTSVFLFAFMLGHGPQTATAKPFSLFTSDDLTIGSRGQAVADLQGILAEMGYLSLTSNTPLGYFGSLTKNALARYQAALGVPNTGYFGPMTRRAIFSQFSSKRWVSSSGDLTIGSSIATAAGTRNSSGTVLGTSTSSNADAQRAPLTLTGYWFNGSWYSSIPSVASSSELGIQGYWSNGMWNAQVSDESNGIGTTTSTMSGTGAGYWYNGTWYQAATTTGGGYFSPNPNLTTTNSSNSLISGTSQTATTTF